MKTVTLHAAIVFAAVAAGCGQAAAECGNAATYAPEKAAHGEMGIAAAHQSLPFGTRVVVRNQRSGRSIVVRIADHNPSLLGGIIDLSAQAMQALGLTSPAPVCLEVVTYGSQRRGYQQMTMRNPLLQKPATKAHTRTAQASGGRKHTAAVHHDSRKRSAKLHRQTQPVRKTSQRRKTASRS